MPSNTDTGVKLLRTTNLTLTGSYQTLAETSAAGENTAVYSQVINQVNALLKYTADAGATNPALQIRFQFAGDGENNYTPPTADGDWYNEQAESTFSAGVSTIVDHVYERAGTAGTAVNIAVPVPVTAKWVRIQVKETKDAGNFGVIQAIVPYQYN